MMVSVLLSILLKYFWNSSSPCLPLTSKFNILSKFLRWCSVIFNLWHCLCNYGNCSGRDHPRKEYVRPNRIPADIYGPARNCPFLSPHPPGPPPSFISSYPHCIPEMPRYDAPFQPTSYPWWREGPTFFQDQAIFSFHDVPKNPNLSVPINTGNFDLGFFPLREWSKIWKCLGYYPPMYWFIIWQPFFICLLVCD